MPDYYHGPALILTALLLPAFGYLFHRFRDARTLLWFLGFFFALVWMVLVYFQGPWHDAQGLHPWLVAFGQASIQISSVLFLASLSPLSFRAGRFQILYAIPYALPAVVAALLVYGAFHGQPPRLFSLFVFPLLWAVSVSAALAWNAAKGAVPVWLSLSCCTLLCVLLLWVAVLAGAQAALLVAVGANLSISALLVIFTFRRISPGVVLSVLGLGAWALTSLQVTSAIGLPSFDNVNFIRIVVMGKVVAAAGMIMLALEDELIVNRMARARERRARRELEAYTRPIFARRRVDDFDRQGNEICRMVVEHSRFAQAALLLDDGSCFALAGSAGFDDATVTALAELAGRIPMADFLAPGAAPSAIEQSQTAALDLGPWLKPGDDLKRLHFISALAVPMRGRTHTEGALLLAGMRPASIDSRPLPNEPLRADDLLPIEMFATRLQATRNQTMMFEKLIDSERLASLGQLAANVAHQLNNPLTVVLGYASLLEETVPLDAPERRGVESILTESRRMRSTLESLLRIARPQPDRLAAVSVSEMLTDMGQLYRSDFLERSIEFQLHVAPSLPRVMCSAQQLRQAVLHCLQYSISAVENHGGGVSPEQPRTIRLEASSEGQFVQIMVAHSGLSFANPDHAFDPFTPAQLNGELAGLGLSLCASILRDHNGRASAVNLDPQGAAIILELRAA